MSEWDKDGNLHAHFGLGRYVPWRLIRSTWRRGHIFIKLLSDMRVGSIRRDEARRVAVYLSKYLGKTFDSPQLFGRHRYDLAQGFQPSVLHLSGRSAHDVRGQASGVMGADPARTWSSAEVKGWDRPPAVWFAWA